MTCAPPRGVRRRSCTPTTPPRCVSTVQTSFEEGNGKCARCNHGKEAPGWRTRVILTRVSSGSGSDVPGRDHARTVMAARSVSTGATGLAGTRWADEVRATRAAVETVAAAGGAGDHPARAPVRRPSRRHCSAGAARPFRHRPALPTTPEKPSATSDAPVGRSASSAAAGPQQKPTPMPSSSVGVDVSRMARAGDLASRASDALRRARTLRGRCRDGHQGHDDHG